jgi:hypothetical protein
LNPAGAPLIRRKFCSDKRSHLSAPPGGGTQQASADQLKQLSSMLEQYDLNNLSEDDQTNISQKLTELGFSASKPKVSFTV